MIKRHQEEFVVTLTTGDQQVLEYNGIVDIICNKCGNTCLSACGYEGLIDQKVTGGFGSDYLGDMNEYKFDICEKCLVEFFKTFLIPVQMTDLLAIETPPSEMNV